MANLPEKQEWIDGIYQLETSDPVVGGPGGVSNRQAEQLADRTAYLKKELESTGEDLQSHIKAADPHTQYAPKASPALTGTPTAPTAAQAANSNQIATTAFVKAAITTLVNGSPGALDTLQELAKALGNDPNFSTTVLNKLAEKLALSGGTMSGSLLSSAADALRLIYGDYGVILRNDGSNFYLLLTNKGDKTGSWNALRPFRIELATGNVTIEHNVDVNTLLEKGKRVYSPNNKPTAADVGALTEAQAVQKYAPLNSPALIGKPTAPTAVQTANDTQIATTAFVKAAVTALVNGAPGALDTLQELAKALGNDPNFSTTVLNEIAKKLPLTGGALSGQLTINNILRVTAPGPALPESQGAHICWNRVVGVGRTDFVNHRGSGSGGFSFWNGNHESLKEIASLDAAGGLYVTGTVSEAGKRVYSPNNKPTAADTGALPAGGTAVAATKLATARKINGVAFDGTKDISLTPASVGALPANGGTLTGNVTIANDSVIKWERSTDYAAIGFNCENDASTNYMYFRTGDNGNEFFRWEHTAPTSGPAAEWMSLKADGLRIKGNLAYHAGNKPTAAEVGAISVSELAGIPLPWPLATAPAGWLKCNGQAFNKTTYPKLAAAYPSGKLPDLRGEFIRGWDDARGADANRVVLSAQSDALKSHNHAYRDRYFAEATGDDSSYLEAIPSNHPKFGSHSSDSDNNHFAFINKTTADTGSNETRPRNIAFNYIVRAA